MLAPGPVNRCFPRDNRPLSIANVYFRRKSTNFIQRGKPFPRFFANFRAIIPFFCWPSPASGPLARSRPHLMQKPVPMLTHRNGQYLWKFETALLPMLTHEKQPRDLTLSFKPPDTHAWETAFSLLIKIQILKSFMIRSMQDVKTFCRDKRLRHGAFGT